jgi:hypothetical protein
VLDTKIVDGPAAFALGPVATGPSAPFNMQQIAYN